MEDQGSTGRRRGSPRGRRVGIAVVALAAAGGAALFLWPTSREVSGYPLSHRLAGEQPEALWRLSPEELEQVTSADAVRLEQTVARLDQALEAMRGARSLLAVEEVEELGTAERQRIRLLWWSVLEPLVAIDGMKHRYQPWWGIDYLRHPRLHARAYAINFTALCAQVDAGQAVLDLLSGNRRVQALLNEAVPDLGLPAGTLRTLRARLARSEDQSFVVTGDRWYEAWIERHLSEGQDAPIAAMVEAARRRVRGRLRPDTAVQTAENQVALLRSHAFEQWFPVQREVAEWFGDTRVVPEDRRLISDAQLAELGDQLRPGDIIVERRNWYLSNVGLPGFWPHAAIHSGTQEDIRRVFDGDEAVSSAFGGPFSEHLVRAHPEAWAALGRVDADGHPHRVVEAVSEGVVATSLEHSCGADYVAALRPRLEPPELARAIDRALGFFGRPYDFNFDFATDDAIVCSELVVKAYEPVEGGVEGLHIDYVEVAGRRAIPPTEIVRAFQDGLGSESAQLDFVWFLDGVEAERRAVSADAQALAASVDRPKWDILQH